jgi:hypothetical protein
MAIAYAEELERTVENEQNARMAGHHRVLQSASANDAILRDAMGPSED